MSTKKFISIKGQINFGLWEPFNDVIENEIGETFKRDILPNVEYEQIYQIYHDFRDVTFSIIPRFRDLKSTTLVGLKQR